MKRSNNSRNWKTTTCLVISILVHAGLIYYIAITQFGDSFSKGDAPKTASLTITEKPVQAVEIEAVKKSPAKPVEMPKKIVKVLPKKEKAAPAPAPKLKTVKAPAPEVKEENIAKEEPQEKTEAAAVVPQEPKTESETEPTPTQDEKPAAVAANPNAVNVEKEKIDEQKVREQLVEKILNEEPPKAEEEAAPVPPIAEEEPKVEATPTPAPAPVVTNGNGNENGTGTGTQKALPVKNDYELKAMPGNKDPRYPISERYTKHQGEVRFMAEVAPDGHISDIRILKSSGYKNLDLAAYQAFKEYKYMPGQQSYVVKSFIFTLKGPTQAAPSRLAVRPTGT